MTESTGGPSKQQCLAASLTAYIECNSSCDQDLSSCIDDCSNQEECTLSCKEDNQPSFDLCFEAYTISWITCLSI